MQTSTIGSIRYVEMVHPSGHLVPIPVSDRHNGAGDGRDPLAPYRAKGFKTPAEVEAEQQRAAERAELEELRAAVAKGKGK